MNSQYLQYQPRRKRRRPTHFTYWIFIIAGFIWTIPWIISPVNTSSTDSLTTDEIRRLIAIYDKATTTTTTPAPIPVTSPATSFVPTEVFPKPKSRRIEDQLNSQQKKELSASELVQQLSLLNSLIDSSKNKAQFFKKRLETPTTPATTTAITEDPATALQSLALLNALLGQNNGAGTDDLTLAFLNANSQSTPSPAQAVDPAAAALTNFLLAQAGGGNEQLQNFNGFTNSQANLDAESSNQLSNILGLLGTLGSLRTSGSNLFNLGLPQQQPSSNFLAPFMPSTTPNILGSMFGGGGGGGNQLQMLSSLLGGQSNSFGQAVATPTQAPGVLASLGSLGSSLYSLAGTALSGLSGTRSDGKPRVRGFDTRLGLGYRLGQGADAQLMWEVGPQIFTEPLENEKPTKSVQELLTPPQNRPYRQPSTQEIQQQLQDQLNSQVRQKVQRRYQVPKKSAAEIEHENIGKLLHASPSKYELDYYAQAAKHREQKLARQKQQMMMMMSSQSRPQPQMHHPPPGESFFHHGHHPGMPEIRRSSIPYGPYSRIRTYPNNGHRPPMLTNYERMLIAQQSQIHNPEDDFRKRTLNISHNQTQTATADQANQNESPKPERKKIIKLKKKKIRPEQTQELREAPLLHRSGPSQMIHRANYFEPKSMVMNYNYPYHRRFGSELRRTEVRNYNAHHYPHPVNDQRTYTTYTPPQVRPKRPKFNPWQNFITEADESFNARNAIVNNPSLRPPVASPTSPLSTSAAVLQNDLLTSSASNLIPTPNVSERGPFDRGFRNPYGDPVPLSTMESLTTVRKLNSLIPGPLDKDFRNPFGDPKPLPTMPSLSTIKNFPAMVPGTSNGVMRVLKSVSKYLFSKEETDKGFPMKNHSKPKDIFHPSTQPAQSSVPTTPEVKLFDPMTGKKISEPKPQEEEDDVRIHYGEGLSYAELAKKLNSRKPTKRPRIRVSTKRPVDLTYAASGDGKYVDDYVEETSPVPPPGMEMFIDIESGEVSIRKPIATLLTFGTTTPRPMTDEELEDHESGKIYERLKEHFTANMEEALLSHEIQKATQDHKEKIMSSKDDSAGMIQQFFELVENNQSSTPNSIDENEEGEEGLKVPGFM